MQPSVSVPIQEYFKIRNFSDVPIPQYERRRTDIFCTILSALFAIIMIGVACYYFNSSVVARWAYPTDSLGKVCGSDYPQQPFMYFASASDTSKRLCLSECPEINDNAVRSYPLSCYPNVLQDNHVQIYDTELEETMMGKFCFPTNPILKQRLLRKSGIQSRYRILSASHVVLYCLLIALLLGIIYMMLVQFIPEIMISVSLVAGGISMIILGVVLLAYENPDYSNMRTFQTIIGVIAVLFGIALFCMIYFCRSQLKITGVFLRLTGRFIKDRPIIYLVILGLILLIILIIALFVVQYLAFLSLDDVLFSAGSPYYSFQSSWGSSIFLFLSVVQLFWGLNFLREASVFIISGLAIQWYTQRTVNPLKNLVCHHWGSVVACSFMVGFFGIPDMIYLMLTPQQGKLRQDGCGRLCSAISSPFESVSMYIRQQAMTYINLTGIPYCNAAVYSEYLNWQSSITRGRGSRPIMRFYRYGAYSFILSLVLIFGISYQTYTQGVVPFVRILIIWVLGLYLISGFVDSHADAASALMITLMLEQQLQGSIDALKCVPPEFIMILKSSSLY